MADLKRIIIHDPVTDSDCSVTAGGDLPVTLDGEEITSIHGRTVLTLAGNHNTTTTKELIAAVAAKKTKVFAITFSGVSATLNTVQLTDGSGGTVLFELDLQSAAGVTSGVAKTIALPGHLLATTANTALHLKLSAAVKCTYSLSYFQEA